MAKIRLAQQPFISVQGEGPRTGRLIIFVRFFGCNLRCPGFFQENPADPTTYVKPIIADPKSFKTLAEFPVPKYGCDTLYAIDPKYKHLAIDYATAEDVVADILSLLPTNPKFDNIPTWNHPLTLNDIDICFTGGEPLMQQGAIVEILQAIRLQNTKFVSAPRTVQFETNGTQMLTSALRNELTNFPETLFNISPKLLNVTGEDAWHPEVLDQFDKLKTIGMDTALKFVVNDKQSSFDELNKKVAELRSMQVTAPVFVMPVGATYEQQSDYAVINKIAKLAIDNGYHISGRLHCLLFGNDHDR